MDLKDLAECLLGNALEIAAVCEVAGDGDLHMLSAEVIEAAQHLRNLALLLARHWEERPGKPAREWAARMRDLAAVLEE